VVVTLTRMMVMKIGLSGVKKAMISTRYNFVPHLVINHLKMDQYLFLDTNL
jgi:hypothetical protein